MAFGEGGFEQVGGIHGAAGGAACADDGVDFVDKQDGMLDFGQLFEHGFDAGFKVAAIFGAGQERAHIQCKHGGTGQRFGHIAVLQTISQALGQRGFAHTGLAHQKRIVFAAAAQGLHEALQLHGAADQRVDTPFACLHVQIDSIFGQGMTNRFALFVAFLFNFVAFIGFRYAIRHDAVCDVVENLAAANRLQAQEIHSMAVFFRHNRHQHVHRLHLPFACRLHMHNRTLNHALEAERGLGVATGWRILGQYRRILFDADGQLFGQNRNVRTAALQHRPYFVALLHQREQQVFDADKLIALHAGVGIDHLQNAFQLFRQHGSHLLNRTQQRMTGLPSKVLHLLMLGISNIFLVNTTQAFAFMMHLQHYRLRPVFR